MASERGPSDAELDGEAAGPSDTTSQEYTVRVRRDGKEKLCMMRFGSGLDVDFSKAADLTVKMKRENNKPAKYKAAKEPRFGAGSEYGRVKKEQIHKRKYEEMLKNYKPEEQPWHLSISSGRQARKFRGVREGTIMENTAYYIFTPCADDAFEAFPVEEWYNFSPVICHKFLNSEEAENEFGRQNKESKSKGKKRAKKDPNRLTLTDRDDLGSTSDEDGDRGEDPTVPQAWLKKNRKYTLCSNSTKNDGEEDGYNLYKDEEDSILEGIDYGSDPSSSDDLEDEEEDSLRDQTCSPDSSFPV